MLYGARGGVHGHIGKPLQQRDCAEPVITVAVRDVDLAQASTGTLDPITDLGRLRCGERRVNEQRVTRSEDECRGDGLGWVDVVITGRGV